MFKWLIDLFTDEEEEPAPAKVLEPVGDLKLLTPKFKKGFSPRVYDNGDLVWMSPDYFENKKLAIDCARKYFCQAWTITDE